MHSLHDKSVGASSFAARDNVQGGGETGNRSRGCPGVWTECRESAWMHVATCFRFVLEFGKELVSSKAALSYRWLL